MTLYLFYGKIVNMSRLSILGKNIKKYREQKGLTQSNLAEKVKLSYEYICRVEKGQKYISLRKFFAIVDALDVNCFDIINFK